MGLSHSTFSLSEANDQTINLVPSHTKQDVMCDLFFSGTTQLSVANADNHCDLNAVMTCVNPLTQSGALTQFQNMDESTVTAEALMNACKYVRFTCPFSHSFISLHTHLFIICIVIYLLLLVIFSASVSVSSYLPVCVLSLIHI